MYLFYDTETTGFVDWKRPADDPIQPHLVQIGAVMTDLSGHVLNHIDLIIYPESWEIPEAVTKIHGITTDMAKAHGVPRKVALAAFNHLYKNAKAVMAHNMDFDYNVMLAQYAKENVPHRMNDVPRHCTMKSATNYVKIPKTTGLDHGKRRTTSEQWKWPTLAETYLFYTGKTLENAHRAMSDTKAVVEIFWEMKGKGHLVVWPESNLTK